MNAHTPGPWFVAPSGNVRYDEGKYSVTICTPMFPDSADARLIAAAPDLLEALKQFAAAEEEFRREVISHQSANYNDALADAYNVAVAAIAKAEAE